MSKKSVISIEYCLMIALATILVIGIITILQYIFPEWFGWNCIIAQRDHIKEMNDITEEVFTMGITRVVKFKVEECVQCIWYDTVDDCLKVKWTTAETPESISIPMKWNGIDESSDCFSEVLDGGSTCLFEITPAAITLQSSLC